MSHVAQYLREYMIIRYSGLLSSQGEKSINFYFIMVPLRKKGIKVWYSKAQYLDPSDSAVPGRSVNLLSEAVGFFSGRAQG